MGCRELFASLQDGEDQNTISADRVRLASQFNLIEEKRDPHIIRNLMNLTFPHRRQLLIQGMSTIREVINLYPILQYERQVYHQILNQVFTKLSTTLYLYVLTLYTLPHPPLITVIQVFCNLRTTCAVLMKTCPSEQNFLVHLWFPFRTVRIYWPRFIGKNEDCHVLGSIGGIKLKL